MAKTVYKKKIKNGKEYYFFRLRHENLDKPKDIYAKTVKELETKIKNITNELEHGVKTNEVLFGDFFKDWLYDVKFVGLKPRSKMTYYNILKNYIKNSNIYNIKLKSLKAIDIQKFLNELYSKQVANSTLTLVNKLIAPCIRYAYNNGYIIKDFSRMYSIPKKSENDKIEKVKPFTIEEQKIFLKAIEGHRFEVLFLVALYTGLRQGEILALTWEDIDFNKNTIIVSKTVSRVKDISKNLQSRTYIKVGSPKTSKGNRVVPLPDFLVKRLKQYKLIKKEESLKIGIQFKESSNLFTTRNGNILQASDLTNIFKKILLSANLKDRKFHDLRHTYATRLFELGESAKTVQELLGHSSISITLDIYTHVLKETKESAAKKLNELSKTFNLKNL